MWEHVTGAGHILMCLLTMTPAVVWPNPSPNPNPNLMTPAIVWQEFEDFLYDSNAALFVTLGKYMLYFGFSIHIVACLWYLIGTLQDTHANYVRREGN